MKNLLKEKEEDQRKVNDMGHSKVLACNHKKHI